MTAPDSPAVGRVRTWLAAFERLDVDDVDRAGVGNVLTASDVRGVLAELDEARRQPRVWLAGDTVPAGAWGLTADDAVHEYRQHVTGEPIVEIVLPSGFDAAVAAERERRKALNVAVPPVEPATSTATDSAREAVSDGSGARESASADGSHTVTEQWDAHGGDVVWRTCSCGERWTNDVETCPEAP